MAAVSPVARARGVAPLVQPQNDRFAALYERHARQVYAFCYRWLRSREEAEDAVQTTFLNAWRGLDRGIVPTSEAAWMIAIARNVCRTATDVRKRRSAEEARDPHVLEDVAAAPPSREEEVAELSQALSELTELQRRAIVMREWQGLSYKEIADELDLTQSAVETLLFRARRSLARKLKRLPTFTPWVKTLLGSGSAKIAAGATAAVIGAAAGEVATHHHPARHARTPVVQARVVHHDSAAPVAPHVQRVAVQPPRHVAPHATHRVAVSRAARPAVPTIAAEAPPAPVRSAPPAPLTPAPSAPSPRGGEPAAPAAPAPAQPTQPAQPAQPAPAPADTPTVDAPAAAATVAGAVGTVGDTVDAVGDTVDGVVDDVSGTVGSVGGAVSDTVNTTVTTVVDTAQSAVSTATTALPPLPPPVKKLLPLP